MFQKRFIQILSQYKENLKYILFGFYLMELWGGLGPVRGGLRQKFSWEFDNIPDHHHTIQTAKVGCYLCKSVK